MNPPLEIIPNEITYVLRCGEYLKIGHSASLEARLRSFQPGNPYEITVLATFPLGELYERVLHRKFAECRHRDEWFRIEGALAEWMQRGFPHKKEIASLLKQHREHQQAFSEYRVAVQQRKIDREKRAQREKLHKEAAAAFAKHEEWRRLNPPAGTKMQEVTT